MYFACRCLIMLWEVYVPPPTKGIFMNVYSDILQYFILIKLVSVFKVSVEDAKHYCSYRQLFHLLAHVRQSVIHMRRDKERH